MVNILRRKLAEHFDIVALADSYVLAELKDYFESPFIMGVIMPPAECQLEIWLTNICFHQIHDQL